MMRASRNQRKKQRTKRNMTSLRRQLQGVTGEAQKAYVTLLAVLAQKGGEVTITKGTIQQVMENVSHLGYSASPIEGSETDVVVRLVVHTPATTNESEPALPFEEDDYAPDDVDGNIAEVVADPTPEPERVFSAVPANRDRADIG